MKQQRPNVVYEIQTQNSDGEWRQSPATRPVRDMDYAIDWARALVERMRRTESFRVVRFPDDVVVLYQKGERS